MKRPRLPALKSLSPGQLALLVLAGILSVWVMGAIAYGFVANNDSEPEVQAAPQETSERSRNLETERESPSPAAVIAPPTPAAQPVAEQPTFTVQCSNPAPVALFKEASFDCQVRSRDGFSADVTITCANIPRGLACTADPQTVKPEPNGAANFKLRVNNYDVDPGKYGFKVVGTGPQGRASAFTFPFDTSVPATPAASPSAAATLRPRVEIQCQTGSTRLSPGQSITYRCTYSSQSYSGPVGTACIGTPGITCTLGSAHVTLAPGGSADVSLSLNVAPNISSAGDNQIIKVIGNPAAGAPQVVEAFTVDVPTPDYALTCPTKTAQAASGETATLKCQVSSTSGYVAPLRLKMLTIDANGPAPNPNPTSVQLGPGGSQEVTVSFDAGGVEPGTYRYALGVHADEKEAFTAQTGDTPHNSVLTVTVSAATAPPSPVASPTP